MNVDLNTFSVVKWIEGTEKHGCGYCKNDSSVSQGMWTERLTVEDYQDLIDRGWRRSGKYCYKPVMDQTCCPLYTIKCDAVNFSLSKSQKRIVKKINKFLKDGEISNKDTSFDDQFFDEPDPQIPKEQPEIDLSKVSTNIIDAVIYTSTKSTEEPATSKTSADIHHKEKCEKRCDDKVNNSSQKLNGKSVLKGLGADPNKPPCKKAKLLRIERKKEKGLSMQTSSAPVQNQKNLEEFLEGVSEDKKKLKMCLIPTSIPNSKWKAVENIEFELYKKYQMIIHNDPPSKLSLNGFTRFLVKSPLKITIERMSSCCNTFSTSAELYKKYQMLIHNEPPEDHDQFYSFLVETPLQPKSFPDGVDGPGYGSFHQQYWLDDKLIAVGVIDILPRCVSSVYFFYDPDYRSLTLGTYGSLREVQLTRQLQKNLPELCYYYMGFYVHSCQKMRYKGRLKPSYLACPETYSWVSIDKCIRLLEANKYSRLNEDIDAIDNNLPNHEDISQMKIFHQYNLTLFEDFKKHIAEPEIFTEIGNLIGKRCTKNLLFWE